MWPHSPIARRSNETGEETTRIFQRPQSPLFPPPAFTFQVTKEAYSLLKKTLAFLYIYALNEKNYRPLKWNTNLNAINSMSLIRSTILDKARNDG